MTLLKIWSKTTFKLGQSPEVQGQWKISFFTPPSGWEIVGGYLRGHLSFVRIFRKKFGIFEIFCRCRLQFLAVIRLGLVWKLIGLNNLIMDIQNIQLSVWQGDWDGFKQTSLTSYDWSELEVDKAPICNPLSSLKLNGLQTSY